MHWDVGGHSSRIIWAMKRKRPEQRTSQSILGPRLCVSSVCRATHAPFTRYACEARVPMLSAAHKETTGAVHTPPGGTDAGRWLSRLDCKRIAGSIHNSPGLRFRMWNYAQMDNKVSLWGWWKCDMSPSNLGKRVCLFVFFLKKSYPFIISRMALVIGLSFTGANTRIRFDNRGQNTARQYYIGVIHNQKWGIRN